jgi:PAS domain S-box-containing protein
MIYQMILTPDGGRRFTYVSDTIQRLNGLSVSAVLSDPDLLYAQVIPEDREALAKAERAAAESFSVFEAIVRFRRADGVLRWQRLCSAPRRLENGGIAWDGIAVDVTEAHEAEQRVKQLNIELESRITARTRELTQANLDLDAFAGSVSHDLRAPTRRIASFSQMLRAEAGALSKEAMHKLEVIESEARHMNELIDALLRLARLGRQELVKQPLALDKIVMHVREQLSEAQADRRLEWVVHPLPVIQGDPDLIGQVFHNLIGNAIKFTRQREVGIIEIGALMSTYPLDMCTLFVRDNGAGFDMRYADKLFGAFQRLHSQQEFEGTGVGLANVKKIVERHGGRVWAESSPQGGATFFFTLPVHQALTENTLFVSV